MLVKGFSELCKHGIVALVDVRFYYKIPARRPLGRRSSLSRVLRYTGITGVNVG